MNLDDSIKDLTKKVSAETTVDASAVAALTGIAKLLADALAAAAAAGATPVQLQSLTDLSTTMTANNDALAAAVTANTPPPATPGTGTAGTAGAAVLSRGLAGGGGVSPTGGPVGGPSSAEALRGEHPGGPAATAGAPAAGGAAPGVATSANIGLGSTGKA